MKSTAPLLFAKLKQKESFLPSLIFIAALSISSIYFFAYMQKWSYFAKYPTLAENIIKTGWLGKNVFGDNPLYIYFHALILGIFGKNALAAALIIQFIIGSFSCVLTYFIAARIFSKKAGVIASLIQALYGIIIVYEGSFVPASLIIFFNSLAILYLLKHDENNKPANLFIAGAFLGLSADTQPNTLLFALFYLIWILTGIRKRTFKKSFKIAALFLSAVILFILPVGIRNYVVGKDAVPVTASAGIVFYSGNNPQAAGVLFSPPKEILPLLDRELTGSLKTEDITVEHKSCRDIAIIQSGKELKPSLVSNYWFNKAFQFIREQPLKYLSLELRKLFFAVNSYEACDTTDAYINYISLSRLPLFNFGIIFPLGLIGIIASLKYRKKLIFIYFMLTVNFLTLLIFYVSSRYRLPVVPFLIIFSAYAITYVSEQLRIKKYKNIILIAAVFLILFSISSFEDTNIKNLRKHQLAYHVYFNQGVKLYREGNYEKAGGAFRKALALDPQLAPRIGRINELLH